MIFAAREFGHLRFELCRIRVPCGGGRIEVGQVPSIRERFGERGTEEHRGSKKRGKTTSHVCSCSKRSSAGSFAAVSASPAQALEAGRKVRDQIPRVLQADMEPQVRAARIPARGGPDAFGMRRNDKAFEAAPAHAHPKELEAVQHCVHAGLLRRLEHHSEKSTSAGEVALPQLMVASAFERWKDDLVDFRTLA